MRRTDLKIALKYLNGENLEEVEAFGHLSKMFAKDGMVWDLLQGMNVESYKNGMFLDILLYGIENFLCTGN